MVMEKVKVKVYRFNPETKLWEPKKKAVLEIPPELMAKLLK